MALINIDGDPWLTDLDACERLSYDIQAQLAARNRQNLLSGEYGRISGTIRVRLQQLASELEQLHYKLGLLSNSITAAESERRQRNVESLQSKLIQLQRQFNSTAPSVEREALFRMNSARGAFANDDDDDPALIPSQSSYSVDDLRSQQTRMLEDQNEGLDALSKVIARQKVLATRIGGEVDLHNEILDDLADTIETTTSGTERENRHIAQITTQDSTWGYWTVIGLLFVGIIVVGIL